MVITFFYRITAFKNMSTWAGVCNVGNQFLPQFPMDLYELLNTFSGHDEDVHVQT